MACLTKTQLLSHFSMVSVSFRSRHRDGFQDVSAWFGGQRIGLLELGQSGEVLNIVVEHPFRRQGVATALWTEALRLHAYDPVFFLAPQHSTNRTGSGQAWALSLGEELPAWIPELDYA